MGLEFFVGVEKTLFFTFLALVSISVIRDIVSYNRKQTYTPKMQKTEFSQHRQKILTPPKDLL